MADQTKPEESKMSPTAASDGAAAASGVKGGKTGSKDAPSMHVRVASPFKVFYDDQALSLSGRNASGAFDILPHHHNFITLLDEGELTVTTSSAATKVRISGGVMHVKADQIAIFLNV